MFELFKGKDNQFYWKLKAKNGETLCVSEGYTTKQNAFKGIVSAVENANTLTVKEDNKIILLEEFDTEDPTILEKISKFFKEKFK